MNLLASSIRAYRNHQSINRLVRRGVAVHHALTPHTERQSCPFAGQCSQAGLEAALALGLGALPAILARMSVCRVMPGDHNYRHYSGCKPPPSLQHPNGNPGC